jgi:hypothetical protein
MPWARIDDAFDDHPKVLAVLEHEQGGAAIGLWTLCLTWAYRNTLKRGKVPGRLPAHLPRRYLGPAARELAALLVKEGLWEALGESDGWQIHDFEQYLATPKTREARSDAGKKGAAARWGNRPGKAAPDGKLPGSDSNLPSGDGNGMATDGRNGPEAASAPGSGTDTAEALPGDGKEPSRDSNLPSGLPFDDDKPIASDGSRAPGRRAIPNGIASRDPNPVPPTAARVRADAPADVTAGTLVAEWIKACRKRPPDRVIGQISGELKKLIDEGQDAGDIRAGLERWRIASKHPSTLASFVNEAMNAESPGRRSPNGHAPYRNPDDDSAYEGTL